MSNSSLKAKKENSEINDGLIGEMQQLEMQLDASMPMSDSPEQLQMVHGHSVPMRPNGIIQGVPRSRRFSLGGNMQPT